MLPSQDPILEIEVDAGGFMVSMTDFTKVCEKSRTTYSLFCFIFKFGSEIILKRVVLALSFGDLLCFFL